MMKRLRFPLLALAVLVGIIAASPQRLLAGDACNNKFCNAAGNCTLSNSGPEIDCQGSGENCVWGPEGCKPT